MLAKFVFSERDLQVLQFVAKFGYCQERQIARLCATNLLNINRSNKRLIAAGYLSRKKIIANQPAYLFLTKSAASFLDVKLVNKVVLHTLVHDTLLIDLYFQLQAEYIDAQIKTDRQIRRELGVHKPDESLHIPDLLINNILAIELELSEKPKAALQKIINNYLINDAVTKVYYYLYSKTLAQKIYTLTNGSPKFKFFIIKQNEDFSFQINELNQANSGTELTMPAIENSANLTKSFGGYVF